MNGVKPSNTTESIVEQTHCSATHPLAPLSLSKDRERIRNRIGLQIQSFSS